MKILVTCKRVPNPEHKLKIGGGKLDLAAASWQLNTFDETPSRPPCGSPRRARGASGRARWWRSASGPRRSDSSCAAC